MLNIKKYAAVVAILLFFTQHAKASLIEFTYTSTVTTSSNSGVAVGDLVSIVLKLDNGIDGLNSQTWTIGDIISGSLSAGSYWQSYTDGWFSPLSHVVFSTGLNGNILSSEFYGTTDSINHEDLFGKGSFVYLFNGGFHDFYGNTVNYSSQLSTLENWTVNQQTKVPEPSVISLLLFGLLCLKIRKRIL